MNTNKLGNTHQDRSDQELVDLYTQYKDRSALTELYERYRVSIGHYLYRDIKSKTAVVNTFNVIMLNLVTKPSHRLAAAKISTRLFAMAYTCRSEYLTSEYLAKESHGRTPQAATPTVTAQNTLESRLAMLPRRHADVVELVYHHNFTFNEAADIMCCPVSVVKNCLAYIKSQSRLLCEGSNAYRTGVADSLSHASVRGQPQADKAALDRVAGVVS